MLHDGVDLRRPETIVLLNIALLFPANAADLGLVAPRPTINVEMKDTLAYCHDVQVNLIAGDALYPVRDDSKTESSISWPVHDDARTTTEKAAYARTQAKIGADRMVVVPTGPDRFVIGSRVRSATAPLPTVPSTAGSRGGQRHRPEVDVDRTRRRGPLRERAGCLRERPRLRPVRAGS